MKFYETPEFKNLRSKWAKKLEKSGFDDAEQEDGNLKDWSAGFLRKRISSLYNESKQEYYRLAGQFLHEHKFEDKLERRIWELHQEGKSLNYILAYLKKKKVKTYRQKIHKVIQKLAAVMLEPCKSKT